MKTTIFTWSTLFLAVVLSTVNTISSYAVDIDINIANSQNDSLDEQVEQMKAMVYVPDVQNVELTYEVEETHHVSWDPGDNLIFKDMTLEEQKAWIAKQETPRTQKKIVIIKITSEGWGYEDIAQSGPIYPKGRDQLEFYNFETKMHTINAFVPDGIETCRPFNRITPKLFHDVILSTRTPAELLGNFSNLPFYDGNSKSEVKMSQIGENITKQIVGVPSGDLMLEANFNTEKLVSAVYYEGPFLVREIALQDYQMNELIGQQVPQHISLKRYSNTKIDQRSDEKLLDSYKYTLVSIKTDI